MLSLPSARAARREVLNRPQPFALFGSRHSTFPERRENIMCYLKSQLDQRFIMSAQNLGKPRKMLRLADLQLLITYVFNRVIHSFGG